MLTLPKIYAVKTGHPQVNSNLKFKTSTCQSAKITMFAKVHTEFLLKVFMHITTSPHHDSEYWSLRFPSPCGEGGIEFSHLILLKG
jgi:hypothetical protein